MRNSLIALTIAVAAVAPPALAADLAVSAAWSRPAVQGGNGAGYLTVTNTGAAADRLLSASSPAAGRVEIHQSMVMNGVAMMHAADRGVAVPAGGKAVLAPGGYHLMLIGLKAASPAGGSVPVTLTFERAGKMNVNLAVRTSAP
jgi:copper(I)-binding protein